MRNCVSAMVIAAMALSAGCSPVPKHEMVMDAEVDAAIADFKEMDPGIQRFFDASAGYAVVPQVFKGAWVIGGAYGKGIVFEGGKAVGYCSLKQATLGFSFGGEYFREIVFFRDKQDVAKFKSEEYTFSAQATAVALTAGAAAKADYKDGMAVFVIAEKGLMVDASVGGQKFNFVPLAAR